MVALLSASTDVEFADPEAALAGLAERLAAGDVVPYLGPGLFDAASVGVPTTPEALADFFGAKVALPRRAKGNAWAAAQYVESMKHRATVTSLMAEAFAPPVEPTALHHYLASLALPLIVDSWYDGAMRAALSKRSDLGGDRAGDWGEVQGITRAGVTEDRWYRFYDAAGQESKAAAAPAWTTLLYKPHGGITPAKNFLISDADYVEVLTEIDIQTPIPDIVKDRRADRSFLFIGCRFHDQLLRTYGRQVMKRSGPEHFVLVDRDNLTRNEARFLVSQGMTPIAVPIERAVELLARAA